MDVLTSETCCALNNEIKKQVTSSWFFLIQPSEIMSFKKNHNYLLNVLLLVSRLLNLLRAENKTF